MIEFIYDDIIHKLTNSPSLRADYHGAMILSITKFSIMTPDMKGFYVTLSIHDTQHTRHSAYMTLSIHDTQHT